MRVTKLGEMGGTRRREDTKRTVKDRSIGVQRNRTLWTSRRTMTRTQAESIVGARSDIHGSGP